MSYSVSRDKMQALGFLPTVAHLPHELSSYEKKLPNGNILQTSKAAKPAARHLGIEWNGRKPVAYYWFADDKQLEDFASAIGGQSKP